MKLGELKKGVPARIISLLPGQERLRFLEMGFLEGEQVEILHEAPWSRDPIAVRVRGATLALRRQEANEIEVEVLP